MVENMSNHGLVESFYEAVGEKKVDQQRGISTGDTDYLRRLFAEDIEWIHPALGGTFHGSKSVIDEVLTPFWQNWELSLDFHRYIEDGDTIVVLATYRGLYKPTGKPFEEPVAHVWDLKDGEIVRFQQYVDTASLWGQIRE